MEIAMAFPASSYMSGVYLGIEECSGFDVPGGGGVARPESREAIGTEFTTRPVLKLHSKVYACTKPRYEMIEIEIIKP